MARTGSSLDYRNPCLIGCSCIIYTKGVGSDRALSTSFAAASVEIYPLCRHSTRVEMQQETSYRSKRNNGTVKGKRLGY